MGRIIAYEEKAEIAADDYLVVDSSTDGTSVFIQPGDTSNLIRLSSAVTTNLLQIRAKFISCYIGGTIHLMERTTGAPNCFDVTLLKSGNPTVVVDDANNTYPVKVYQ